MTITVAVALIVIMLCLLVLTGLVLALSNDIEALRREIREVRSHQVTGRCGAPVVRVGEDGELE